MCFASVPRIRTAAVEPVPPACVSVSPGTRRRTFAMSFGDSLAISSAVMTVIALPARLIACEVRVAVTTKSGAGEGSD